MLRSFDKAMPLHWAAKLSYVDCNSSPAGHITCVVVGQVCKLLSDRFHGPHGAPDGQRGAAVIHGRDHLRRSQPSR
jgi:hypothetical protein